MPDLPTPAAIETPAVTPAESTPSSATPATTPSATPSEPFLSVNERTRYASKEDAVRGFTEAQSRIAQLSPWEALMKEGFTPQQVQQYLDELADRRQKETAAATPAAQTPKQLTPEWQQHIDFLKSQGIFTTMDELKTLQQQVQTLTQGQQGEQAARVEASRSNGEFILNGLIKESGLTLDEAGNARIANSVEDSIVRVSRDAKGNILPNSPEDRFIRGDAAERSAIIKEHFNWFMQFGDAYAKRATATLVDQKAAAQAASPRPLPQSTSPVPVPAKPGQGFKSTDINERVAAAMAAEASRRGGGPLL